MSALIELDEKRRRMLEQMAHRRKVSVKRIFEKAIDEFIEHADDEELLESSARVARRTKLRKENAVAIVRHWRGRNPSE